MSVENVVFTLFLVFFVDISAQRISDEAIFDLRQVLAM